MERRMSNEDRPLVSLYTVTVNTKGGMAWAA